jgi:hypothetical protein
MSAPKQNPMDAALSEPVKPHRGGRRKPQDTETIDLFVGDPTAGPVVHIGEVTDGQVMGVVERKGAVEALRQFGPARLAHAVQLERPRTSAEGRRNARLALESAATGDRALLLDWLRGRLRVLYEYRTARPEAVGNPHYVTAEDAARMIAVGCSHLGVAPPGTLDFLGALFRNRPEWEKTGRMVECTRPDMNARPINCWRLKAIAPGPGGATSARRDDLI